MITPKIAALFDMDGVLIDSVRYHWLAMNEVLADYDIHIADADLHKYIGQPLYTQVKQLSEEYNKPLNYDEFLTRTAIRKQELLENIEPKEGVVTLLELLKANDVPMAIATSNTRSETERRLEGAGIRDYFSVLITEDDVAEHKPDPTVYLTAAKAIGASPETCIVFEDAPAGILSAKRAGMRCIAIQTPVTSPEDLSEASLSVASLSDVSIELIEKL